MMLRIDYRDQLHDFIDKVNRTLVPFNVRFKDDEQPHDGFCLFTVERIADPTAPQWASAAPAAPGWYWFRNGDDSPPTTYAPVQILPRRKDDATLIACGPFGSLKLADVTWGQWCGPIAVPPT